MCLASLENARVLALTPAFLEPNPFRALIVLVGAWLTTSPSSRQPHSAEELSVSITPWGFCLEARGLIIKVSWVPGSR